MEGLAQVQARIAEIKAQFPVPSRPVAATSQWAAAAASAGLKPAGGVAASPASGTGTVMPTNAAQSMGGSGSAGAAVIEQASKYLGVPYRWGGTDPSTGLDCSGFTQLVYKSMGIELPRVSSQQATAGKAVASLADARPGDLLFFDYSPDRPGIDHVGIYMGDGKMIAAPQPGDVVKVQSVGQPTVIRRVLPDG
jgi:cell wall-associated NlpC family hydrolase